MSRRKPELYAIVADLHAARYRASDIARVLNRSHERISQILRDIGLGTPKLDTLNDLPHDLRMRVTQFMESDTPFRNPNGSPAVPCETS